MPGEQHLKSYQNEQCNNKRATLIPNLGAPDLVSFRFRLYFCDGPKIRVANDSSLGVWRFGVIKRY